MMQRCSSSSHGACLCGLYHNSLSMFFSMSSNGHRDLDEGEMLYSPSVDCTLSLGMPSTRRTHNNGKKRSSGMSSFGWNILHSKHSLMPSSTKTHRAGISYDGGYHVSDPLLGRRCANCGTTSTPLWRNGPRGPKSLCNACGIRFKKEERRATAVAATSNVGSTNGMVETDHLMMNTTWIQPQKLPCYRSACGGNDFRFIDNEVHHDSETANPFVSWHFNVTDRTDQLVHDFTR